MLGQIIEDDEHVLSAGCEVLPQGGGGEGADVLLTHRRVVGGDHNDRILEGAISGRALYDGRIDPLEAISLLRQAA